uniref:L1 transposable element RRM domain-containing protein n=1 Tax=Stegastes partitus TaxID=144197 RepID=A0A3B4ZN95_9TELE
MPFYSVCKLLVSTVIVKLIFKHKFFLYLEDRSSGTLCSSVKYESFFISVGVTWFAGRLSCKIRAATDNYFNHQNFIWSKTSENSEKCPSQFLKSLKAGIFSAVVLSDQTCPELIIRLLNPGIKIELRVEDNTKRIAETENRISDGEDRTTTLEKKLAELEQKFKILTDRAEDNENRSRRDNIRILGLREGTEGNQPVDFFATWLPDVLGLETKRGTMKIDRAHRALGPRKENYNRPIIIKLHNFSDKQRILAAVRKKGEISYQGDKIYIRQDLSTQVREARRQFNGVCERLIQRGLRFQMRYPASLCFTFNGEERCFKSPREAEEFLSKNG